MSRSVSIPLRDSLEDAENLKRIRRFSVEVWNVTQNWLAISSRSSVILDRLVNNKLRIMYGKHDSEQQLTGGSEGVETLISGQDIRLRLTAEILRDAEELCDLVKELGRVVAKLHTAQSRVESWVKLWPNPGAGTGHVLQTLTEVIPDLIKMYDHELSVRQAGLADISEFEHRDVFAAVALSYKYEPFIDENVLSSFLHVFQLQLLEFIVVLQEIIEISFDALPEGDEVLEILRAEKASLHFWIDLGLEYYRCGRVDDFVRLLEVSGSEASLDYPEVENDQMRALDILAAYYVRLGHKERTSKEKKRDLFSKATLLYTTADRIKMYDMPHLTGRAYFCLVEARASKVDQADQQFNFVLKQDPYDIPAMMGKAIIAFSKQDYKTALYFLKRALRQKPSGPADMRVGIGYCLARLGITDKARIAFERALELQHDNVCALSAIAILDYNTHTVEGAQSAVLCLGQAYSLEPENPVVLVHLANHFFFKGEMNKVERLAWHAMSMTESDEIKAEACYILARYFHYSRDYEKAFKYYYQATTLNHPTFVLPQYGLGQLYIMRGEFNQAITAFETVLKAMPNNVDTMKVLSALYAHTDPGNQERQEKAREMLTKVLEAMPNDVEVLIDLAQLLEGVDPQKSLTLYETACELIKPCEDGQMDAPAAILNNIGALHMTMENYERAKEYFEAAEAKLQEDLEGDLCDSKLSSYVITMRYNLARCLEHLCLFEDAEVLYKAILREQENYTDCYLRLGCLARDRGQIYESSVWFKEAMSVDQNNADSWVLIGNLHMSKHEWGPGQKKFEQVLNKMDKEDAYSWVSLGNVWMEMLFNLGRKKTDDLPAQEAKYMDRALQMFGKALKIEPKNIWAANGIGCVLASKAMWQDARDIFAQVREATSEFEDVWMNIAHVYIELGQYVPALQMYSNAIKKFDKEQDHQCLLYLARAYYKAGRLTESLQTLEKAMSESPDNVLIKFNYAFVLKLMATEVLQEVKSTAAQVRGAMDDLKTAGRVFSYISATRDEALSGSRYVSRTHAGDEARACDDLLKQAQTYLVRAQQRDEEDERQRAKQHAEREALRQKLAQEIEEREKELREKQASMASMRNEYVQMTKNLLRIPELVDEKKGGRGGGGGRRRKGDVGDEFVNDSSDMGSWHGEEGRGDGERRRKDKSASKKAARKRREKRAAEAGSGSDDESAQERRRRRKEASERKSAAKLSQKQSAKIKSKAFLSSEEDSSDGAPVRVPEDVGDESPRPPRITDSDDTDDSIPRHRRKKTVMDSDDEQSDSGSGGGPLIGAASDSDEASNARKSPVSDVGSGGSDSAPRKKKKQIQSSDESD
ncbi:RNA polymerase-associated protein CTR9 [Trichostrongylus colubriformis]|uniref:RNA polymerase-associated protein CTR9 n=1 Tax=Trichostrongylus colubriformis TaxID=6319 RepID=A0AAN8FIJ5_TRICO